MKNFTYKWSSGKIYEGVVFSDGKVAINFDNEDVATFWNLQHFLDYTKVPEESIVWLDTQVSASGNTNKGSGTMLNIGNIQGGFSQGNTYNNGNKV